MSQPAPRGARPAASQQQLATREQDPIASLQGSFREASDVNQRLNTASSRCHLVAPATSVGALPEGCAVALSIVQVDLREMAAGGEVYDVGGGKLGIGKSVLDRIAAAAGISWDPQLGGRVDDGSDPYYCHFRAVAHVRHFDGTEQVLTGEKEMDLRPGSPQVQALQARLRPARPGQPPPTIDKQLRELRLHILAHAESKAKNRAIRSLGLKSGFTKEDLAKPFVVAKLMWTGQTKDPSLRRLFAEMTAERMLGGSRALFGVAGNPRMPPGRQLKSPPPLGAIGADDDDFMPEPQAMAPPQQQQPALPASDEPRADGAPVGAPVSGPGAENKGASGFTIPGGPTKGTPIESATDKDLKYWVTRIDGELTNGKVEDSYIERNENLLAAIRDELATRAKSDQAEGIY